MLKNTEYWIPIPNMYPKKFLEAYWTFLLILFIKYCKKNNKTKFTYKSYNFTCKFLKVISVKLQNLSDFFWKEKAGKRLPFGTKDIFIDCIWGVEKVSTDNKLSIGKKRIRYFRNYLAFFQFIVSKLCNFVIHLTYYLQKYVLNMYHTKEASKIFTNFYVTVAVFDSIVILSKIIFLIVCLYHVHNIIYFENMFIKNII